MPQRNNKKYSKLYMPFSRIMRVSREHCSTDPFEDIGQTGPVGKLIAHTGNKILEKPTHNLCFRLVRYNYNPESDNPYKGSALYTVWYFFIKKAYKGLVGLFFGLPACSALIAIRTADLITQLRVLSSIALVLLLICGVCRLMNWFKRIF